MWELRHGDWLRCGVRLVRVLQFRPKLPVVVLQDWWVFRRVLAAGAGRETLDDGLWVWANKVRDRVTRPCQAFASLGLLLHHGWERHAVECRLEVIWREGSVSWTRKPTP